MKVNIVVEVSPPISYLEKFWFSSYGPKMLTANLQKSMEDEVYFLPADKHKRFL